MCYGGISDADMEKGQLRCDVNVSVRPMGQEELGVKIELKNMNSISAVRRALHHEIGRQCDELDAGHTLEQATWRWNDEAGVTEIMRLKEDAHDYRYFPDPDLLPVRSGTIVDRMREHVIELPHARKARYEKEFGLSPYDASVLSSDVSNATYFESSVPLSDAPPKKVANWVINTLFQHLNDASLTADRSPVSPGQLAATVNLVESGQVSNNQGREVFETLWQSPDRDPAEIAREMGFEPADAGAIEALIDQVIADHPDKVAEIRGGNEKLVNFLTGQVMKASQGKANPKQVTESTPGQTTRVDSLRVFSNPYSVFRPEP